MNRPTLQTYFLIAFGIVLLLIGLLLHPTLPIGLFLFGIGSLVAALIYPKRVMIAGLLFTCIGAAIFIAYKPLFRYDNALVVIAVGLALLGIAVAARRGYVGKGAMSPGILVLLVGLLLYPSIGGMIDAKIAPFILSLLFPGAALLLLGVIYLALDTRKRGEK